MKSKIEQKIEKAREATNEMLAAFEELNESLKEKELEKYLPQRGEYIFHKWADRNGSSASNIIILKSISDEIINAYVYFCSTSKNCVDLGLGLDGYVNRDDDVLLRPATPSEIALLDSKLAEQGNRFDKEKLELVDIPKYKKPVVGEMAIMWRSDKGKALCRIYGDYEDGRHYDSVGIWADHAILFESVEQYKAFLKS